MYKDIETEATDLYKELAFISDLIDKLQELACKKGYSDLSEDANMLMVQLTRRKRKLNEALNDVMHEAVSIADALMDCDKYTKNWR